MCVGKWPPIAQTTGLRARWWLPLRSCDCDGATLPWRKCILSLEHCPPCPLERFSLLNASLSIKGALFCGERPLHYSLFLSSIPFTRKRGLETLFKKSWYVQLKYLYLSLTDWLIDGLMFLKFSKLPHNSHSQIEKKGTLSPKDKARGQKKISWFRLTSTWYRNKFKLANINYTLGTCPELLWEKQGWHFSVFVPYRLTQKTWSTLRVGWIHSAYFTEK